MLGRRRVVLGQVRRDALALGLEGLAVVLGQWDQSRMRNRVWSLSKVLHELVGQPLLSIDREVIADTGADGRHRPLAALVDGLRPAPTRGLEEPVDEVVGLLVSEGVGNLAPGVDVYLGAGRLLPYGSG